MKEVSYLVSYTIRGILLSESAIMYEVVNASSMPELLKNIDIVIPFKKINIIDIRRLIVNCKDFETFILAHSQAII